jgi:hypothetical protein
MSFRSAADGSGRATGTGTANSGGSPTGKLSRRKSSLGGGGGALGRASSFRLNGRIDDLLVEHGDTPLAIMCRRDFLKAQQDEVLLKSNKHYIRNPIERKIGLSGAGTSTGTNSNTNTGDTM